MNTERVSALKVDPRRKNPLLQQGTESMIVLHLVFLSDVLPTDLFYP